MRNDRRRSRGIWITPVANMADDFTISEALAFLAFWPSLALAGWAILDPYGFRDALLRALGVA